MPPTDKPRFSADAGVLRARPHTIREPSPGPAGRRDGLPRWPLWAPFAGMLGVLLVAVVGVGVIALVVELAGVETGGEDPPAGLTIGGTFVQAFAMIGVACRPISPPSGSIV